MARYYQLKYILSSFQFVDRDKYITTNGFPFSRCGLTSIELKFRSFA